MLSTEKKYKGATRQKWVVVLQIATYLLKNKNHNNCMLWFFKIRTIYIRKCNECPHRPNLLQSNYNQQN